MITRRAIWISAIIAAISAPSRRAETETLGREAAVSGALGVASTDSDPGSIRATVDLASVFAGGPLRVLPVIGQGPVQDVADLLARKGVDVALVPSDVLSYLRRTHRLPTADQGLHYIAELYREDVHVLAQRNFARITDLAGKPVNIGATDSRAYITASSIFDALRIGIQPVSLDQVSALEALRQGRIAALVHVARRPAQLFFALNQNDGVHFLSVPPAPELSYAYVPSHLGTADYPLLIGEGEVGRGQPIPTVAVPIVLAVCNWAPGTERYRRLALLIDTLFPLSAASRQEAPQDSIWAEFDPFANVPGWSRFAPAMMWLQGKPATAGAKVPAHPIARQGQESARLSGSRFHPLPQEQLDATRRQEQDELFEKLLRWERERGLGPNRLSESSR
jgi:uncharacterized protein